jgi:hypothetical protein
MRWIEAFFSYKKPPMEAADIIRIRQDERKTSEMKFHLAVSFHSNVLTLIVVNNMFH